MGRRCTTVLAIVVVVALVVVLGYENNVKASSPRHVAAAGWRNAGSSQRFSSSLSSLSTLTSLRAGGGASGGETKKKKKGKKKKKKKSTAEVVVVVDDAEPVAATDKKAIQQAMKEKDTAEAMGDAIRDRSEDWLRDDPFLHSIDATVSSVGWAMGTASSSLSLQQQQQQYDEQDDGGGVETATSSVLAHYFLKSHGGAHALQSACSLFAVFLSMMALIVAPTTTNQNGLQTVLLKRAFLCAMTKHLAGLLAATGMTATAIPKIGLGQARRWMEQLARDPVSQYVFYSALLMVWLSTPGHEWYSSLLPYGSGKYIPLLLVGPVLIREAISTAFVVSDVLLLLQASSPGGSACAAVWWWKACTACMNAFMSLLVTPTVWRTSSASQRQVMLAKWTAQTCLAMEVCVGLLLGMDAVMAVWQFTVVVPRPSLVTAVAPRILCARLYINFLWVRRKKIQHLSRDMRGGAGLLPIRLLDVLYDPYAAMGIPKESRVLGSSY